MESNGADLIDAADIFCQMLDFYKCKGAISLANIKHSSARGNLFSVAFHYQRLQEYDQKDPYTQKNYLVAEKTLWEKYCRRQYDMQVQGAQGDGF